MRRHVLALALLAATAPATVRSEVAGEFDYWVMALSWSPSWCEAEGDARGSEQCARPLGFVLHGLWPQYERGWPDYCQTAQRNPSRAMTGAMADIMGTGGSAWHQWNKHGTCSGLSASDYYDLSRLAYGSVERPAAFAALGRDVTLPASLVEDAFLDANPDLSADGVTITCRDGAIREVRICLDRSLRPRECGADVARDCTLTSAALPAVR
ncbi:MAG: ribonuclease T2 family protein [Paracoccaceae bacterium]